METASIQRIGDGRIVIDGETYVTEKSSRVIPIGKFLKMTTPINYDSLLDCQKKELVKGVQLITKARSVLNKPPETKTAKTISSGQFAYNGYHLSLMEITVQLECKQDFEDLIQLLQIHKNCFTK